MSDDREILRCELRATGDRSIAGTLLQFGDVADLGRFRERFEPDVDVRTPLILNLEHDRTAPLAVADVQLDLEELRIAATMPEGRRQDQALEEIDAGRLRGLSVEFRCLAQRWEQDLRIVARSVIYAAGLTGSPVYTTSELEHRSRLADPRGGSPVAPIRPDPPRRSARRRRLLLWR